MGMAGYWYVGSILRKYCLLRLTYVEKDQCSNNPSQRFFRFESTVGNNEKL